MLLESTISFPILVPRSKKSEQRGGVPANSRIKLSRLKASVDGMKSEHRERDAKLIGAKGQQNKNENSFSQGFLVI